MARRGPTTTRLSRPSAQQQLAPTADARPHGTLARLRRVRPASLIADDLAGVELRRDLRLPVDEHGQRGGGPPASRPPWEKDAQRRDTGRAGSANPALVARRLPLVVRLPL